LYESLGTQGYGAKLDVLQAFVGYERFWGKNYVGLRAGELSTAFGQFALRYDDGDNPLIDVPLTSGYYYKPATTLGLTGAQVDLTLNKVDLRLQASTSSPGNRRSPFDNDQYLNWTAGAGYTIVQGFRVGVSAYRGPYLHRGHRFYLPGERNPIDLPSTGLGIDLQFARGHWNFSAELQRFQRAYSVFPTFEQWGGYGEVKYAFHPRWFVAGRYGHLSGGPPPRQNVVEVGVGFRPNRRQIVKLSYQAARGLATRGSLEDVLGIQLVTRLSPISCAVE
jgi:hypothetical protein